MTAQNIICVERLTKEFDTLFDYTFQIRPKLKLLNINIIQNEHYISIDQTYHITKNIIQEYCGTKTKEEGKFKKHPFPVDTSSENDIFIGTPLIVDNKKIEKKHGGSINQSVGGLIHITVQA